MKIIHNIDLDQIDFLFFDKGGTLSYHAPYADGGEAAARKIMDFLGVEGDVSAFQKTLFERNKKYKTWSLKEKYEDTVEDMCHKWLFHDAPYPERVRGHEDELVIMAAKAKADRVMYPEATPLIKTLKKRGYRIGLISNTVSPTMVPAELRAAGIYDDFEVLVMSSVERIRKPDPEIFRLSCERAGVAPERCLYIGDAPDRDVEGPRKAGFKAVVIIEGEKYNPETDQGPMRTPDILVRNLEELYDLFPDRRVS